MFQKKFLVAALIFPAAGAMAMGPLTVGVRGGFPYSTFSETTFGGGSVVHSYSFGKYLIGPTIDVSIGPFSLQTDLLLARRSYGGDVNSSVTLNRIELPTEFKYSFFPFLNVGAGLYYAKGVGSVAREIGGVASEVSYSAGDFSGTDVGFVASVGTYLPAGIVGLSFDVRYQHGFNNLAISSNTRRHRSVDLVAGVWF